jgi:hypothetical protein
MTLKNDKADKRSVNLNLRTGPSVRQMMMDLAKAQRRSMTNVIELLVIDAHAKLDKPNTTRRGRLSAN